MAIAAPSVSTFLESYPEFSGATEALISAKLAEAALRTNGTTLGDNATAACMLRAAILLMRSPWARKMRADAPDQITTWSAELRELQRAASVGLRVFVT